jgi:hypothetical protein
MLGDLLFYNSNEQSREGTDFTNKKGRPVLIGQPLLVGIEKIVIYRVVIPRSLSAVLFAMMQSAAHLHFIVFRQLIRR